MRMLSRIELPRDHTKLLTWSRYRDPVFIEVYLDHALALFRDAPRRAALWAEVAPRLADRAPAPLQALAWATAGMVCSTFEVDLDAAKLALQRATRLAGPDASPELRARIALPMASVLHSTGKTARAFELIDELIKLFHTGTFDQELHAALYMKRGNLLLLDHELEASLEAYGQAVSIALAATPAYRRRAPGPIAEAALRDFAAVLCRVPAVDDPIELLSSLYANGFINTRRSHQATKAHAYTAWIEGTLRARAGGRHWRAARRCLDNALHEFLELGDHLTALYAALDLVALLAPGEGKALAQRLVRDLARCGAPSPVLEAAAKWATYPHRYEHGLRETLQARRESIGDS